MKVGVCGLGNMGRNHKRVLEKLGHEVVCYDPKISQYSNWKKFIVQKLEAVTICCPTDQHVDMALKVIRHYPNIKILIEKPISINGEDADRLSQYHEQIRVGHIERYNPVVQWLRNYKTKFYVIKFTRINNVPSRELSDVALDLMVHDIDIAHFAGYRFPYKHLRILKESSNLDNIYDIATAHGVSCRTNFFFEASWVSPIKKRTIEFTCEDGYGLVDLIQQEVILIDHSGRKIKPKIKHREPLLAELEDFLGAQKYCCTVYEAIENIEYVCT